MHRVADWERAAGASGLARVARHCRRAGYFYVGVCDHIAIPERLCARRMGTYWQDCIAHAVVARPRRPSAPACSRTRTCSPTATRSSPPRSSPPSTTSPVGGPSSGSAPGTCEREFEPSASTPRGAASSSRRSCRRSSTRWSTSGSTGSAPAPPGAAPRPPVWMAGSSPAAIRPRRAATPTAGCRRGRRTRSMVAMLRGAAREQHGRAGQPMMIGHITPWLYVGKPDWDVARRLAHRRRAGARGADPRRHRRGREPDPGALPRPQLRRTLRPDGRLCHRRRATPDHGLTSQQTGVTKPAHSWSADAGSFARCQRSGNWLGRTSLRAPPSTSTSLPVTHDAAGDTR